MVDILCKIWYNIENEGGKQWQIYSRDLYQVLVKNLYFQ